MNKTKLFLGVAVGALILASLVLVQGGSQKNSKRADTAHALETSETADEIATNNAEASAVGAALDRDEPGSTSSSYKADGSQGATGAPHPPAGVSMTAPKSSHTKPRDQWKQAAPLAKTELVSVEKFFNLAFRFAASEQKPDALLKALEQEKLSPVAAEDANEDTGKMTIVRTDKALEGTRYFHAQFFEDEKKRTYLQHLSFEIRPSPDCVEQAVAMIEKRLGLKAQPLQAPSNDYALYKAPSDYIIWVKRLQEEDLDSDHFNPRDPVTDVGACRAAIEKDIHAHENH